MSDVISAISLDSQLGSPNLTEDLLPHSDCSNNGTCSDTASQKSDDKSSVSGDHIEDASPLLPQQMDIIKQDAESESTTSDYEDSSGMYYVQVKGLPRFYRLGELKKLLTDDLGLTNCSVRSPRRASPWISLCFQTRDEQQQALNTLNGYDWKKRHLTAEVLKTDPLKRKTDSDIDDDGELKKLKVDVPVEERIKMATVPFWNIPYEEQLVKKRADMEAALEKLCSNLGRSYPELSGWAEQQAKQHTNMACELSAIKPSPVTDGYRNKCEFRIGLHPETKERTVGFRLASFKEGSMGVGPVYCLRHLPDRMKETVKAFEKYVRTSSLSPFVPETHEGHWRQVTVRVSSRGDVLLLAVIHPQNLTEDQLEAVKADLRDYFETGAGRECNLTALFFQTFVEKQEGVSAPPVQHLMGQQYLKEKLMGLEFRVSADAYFQVNTAGAQELYAAVAELSNCDPQKTTLLDICCSAGGIGLSLAKQCKQVLGIECVAQGVEDARYNASSNGIENCEFFCGRAEDVLPTLTDKITGSQVVAVVDPPRGGLHKKIVNELRKMENVKRLIYVSTNPKIVIKNFTDLCRPGSKDGANSVFLPIKAIPVDIFPHTTHCQLVLCFERVDLSSLPVRKKLPPLIKSLDSMRGNNRGRGFSFPNNKLRGQYRQANNPFLLAYQQGLKMCPPLIEDHLRNSPAAAPELLPLVNPFSFPEIIFPPRARGFPPARRIFPSALPPGIKRAHPASFIQIPMPPNPLESLFLRQQYFDLSAAAVPRLPGQPMRARGMRRGFSRPAPKK
ncbi:tRNA (uracil-5-)-methyltransferase homolog A-like [Neocloeon triangulifer]|uniref:tRNA (uracil-5-)-methyltransferase homolog A-like n=1 Tax=Neocloeon triangulifer TaxID=2078957 RepID=UPI00286F2351|nr:tRNA (uracil-5-)-methyltransferase homolog A-like [Neocloeon triangulifer]